MPNGTTPPRETRGVKPRDLVQGMMNYAIGGLVFCMPLFGKKRELVEIVNAKWASISMPKTTFRDLTIFRENIDEFLVTHLLEV
jgi:hypothetical protein